MVGALGARASAGLSLRALSVAVLVSLQGVSHALVFRVLVLLVSRALDRVWLPPDVSFSWFLDSPLLPQPLHRSHSAIEFNRK